MKKLVIELKDKFAERQIEAGASIKGWQPVIANPKRRRAGQPTEISNPLTAEEFLKNAFVNELNEALVAHESRQAAADMERQRRVELEKELSL